MSKRLIALFAGVLAIGLIVTGCGSSDDSDSSSTSSLTKAQFIKQADAICKTASGDIEDENLAYAKENGIDVSKEPTDEQKEELITEVVIPSIERQAEKIEALGAPSGEEDQVDAIVAAVQTAAQETADDPSLVIKGEEGAFEDANELARDYGLKVCGRN